MRNKSMWLRILNGRYDQSYKPIVCLAIFELAADPNSSSRRISKEAIVKRVSEFFFHLEDKFALRHGTSTNEVWKLIFEIMNSPGYTSLPRNANKWRHVWTEIQKIPGTGKATLEKIWIKLKSQPLEIIHDQSLKYGMKLFDITNSGITITRSSYNSINSNFKDNFKPLAMSKLANFLGSRNPISPTVFEKVQESWTKDRPPIPDRLKKLIKAFNPIPDCYICGNKLSGTYDLDHVVPYKTIASHDIWNLMPACGSSSTNKCNQSKSTRKPYPNEISEAEKRNKELINWINLQNGNSYMNDHRSLQDSLDKDYLNKLAQTMD